MEELVVSKEAQVSLIKFLARIELIPPQVAEADYTAREECPILHFARAGLFEEWRAIETVARRLEVRFYRMDKQNAVHFAALLDDEAVCRIGVARWLAMRALPAEITPERITVMMANPLDHGTRSMLEFELARRVQIAVGSEREIVALLSTKQQSSRLYDLDAILDASAAAHADREPEHAPAQESNIVAADLEAAPIVRLVNKIFADAVHQGASDVHITPEKDQVVVRIRVDGIMRTLFTVPNAVRGAVVSRIKLLGGMDISEKRKPQDGRMRIKTGLGVKDLRLSTVPTLYGENLVIRILSSDIGAVSFKSLGMPDEVAERCKTILSGSSRVVLVCGPTGSGKTSTLYAALLHLADGKRNIITVEDPIEYRVPGITQIQVNPKIGIGFAEGLRSILRQDPDVIMVGEVRDGETAGIAMQAAQTGHLVLSTIHTNSAPAAVTRLLDLEVAPYMIAASLGSIIAQRLVRTLCPQCKAPAGEALAERCRALGLDPGLVREPKGCEECGGSGFKGRTAIFSFLEVDDEVRRAIRDNRGEAEIMRQARGAGFRNLEEDALVLLSQGVTSMDEIERVVGPIVAAEAKAAPSQPAELKPLPAPAAAKPPKGALNKRKVLLVEDDDDVRFILGALLQKEMFDVREARDGLEALERIYEEIPEVIVCDLMMPRMDGLELVDRLKRDERTARIPLLMMTAADSEDNELKLLNRGVDDFMSKASSADVLVARLHRLLARGAGASA